MYLSLHCNDLKDRNAERNRIFKKNKCFCSSAYDQELQNYHIFEGDLVLNFLTQLVLPIFSPIELTLLGGGHLDPQVENWILNHFFGRFES